eukprot:gene19577-21508_t
MANEDRVKNFFPGPSALPVEVLHKAAKEMLNYKGLGYGVMEMSHRSKEFQNICAEAEQDIRDLMVIPDNYKIMFLQGGCTGMFAAVALNFLPEGKSADYIITGTWSDKAAIEAEKYGKVNRVLPKATKYTSIPPKSEWKHDKDAAYVYYCSNETVGEVYPISKSKPICSSQLYTLTHHNTLVCQLYSPGSMSIAMDIVFLIPAILISYSYCNNRNRVQRNSRDQRCPSHLRHVINIMTKEFNVTKFACIVGGAQKLLGPAGVTIVIARDDMLGKEKKECPTIWNFKKQAELKSALNTPPCYSIYIMGLVLKWMKAEGGVKVFEERNSRKAELFYKSMERSNGFYEAIIDPEARSRVNIPFRVGKGDAALEKKFVQEAKSQGLDGLAGHRSVGGCRASMYNAVTYDDVRVLTNFMREFQLTNQN